MSAIAFDLDDTLYDLCWPYARAVSDCFSGKYDRLAEALFMRSRVHSDEVFEDWSSGRMRTDDMYAYRNLKSFDDFGIRITREEALRIQDLYKEYQKRISLTEDVKRMLTVCRDAGIRMGIVTNGPGEHQRAKIRTLGLLRWFPEDRIVISGEVGAAKPGTEIFRIAAERLGTRPADAWYIGDTFANDVAAPRAAGWRTLWVNRRGNPVPAGETPPDRTVPGEREMADAVCRMVRVGRGVF